MVVFVVLLGRGCLFCLVSFWEGLVWEFLGGVFLLVCACVYNYR